MECGVAAAAGFEVAREGRGVYNVVHVLLFVEV